MARPGATPQFRERAVRLVRSGVRSAGYTTRVTLSLVSSVCIARRCAGGGWSKADGGERPGPSRAERSRIVELERENKELRRAMNLEDGGSFLRAELDRRSHK